MKSKRIIGILLTTLVLFIALTALVITENEPIANLNHRLYVPFAGIITPALTTIATLIGSLTHWYTYAPIILLLLILPRTRMKIGLPMGLTLGISAILGPIILKNVFAIERPGINPLIDPGGFGYPSGHSMNAMVFFGISAIMVLRYSSNQRLKQFAPVLAAICILLVGLSRIYLGVHTATDVLGGYLAGSVVLCASVLIEARLRKR